MSKNDNHQNWGINDYCKTMTQDMIAFILATCGPNVVTFKPLLDALKFSESEAQILAAQPGARISTMASKILSSQTKLSQFKQLLERGYLRGTFPTNTEFDLGYPILVPHRLIIPPQTSQVLNFKIVIQMFMGSYPTLVQWLNFPLIRKFQENSKILKQDTFLIFEENSQVHQSVFPDRFPTIYEQYLARGSQFFLNIWYVLEHKDYFHLIQMDYLSARQLSYMQSNRTNWSSAECIDCSNYLDKKRAWEDKFLSLVSFNGIDPFNWMQKKQQGINPYNRTSEKKDYDMEAQSFIMQNVESDSILGLNMSRISQEQSVLPVEQRVIQRQQGQIDRLQTELGLVQQFNQQKLSGISLSSPSKCIQIMKAGTTVSYVLGKVIKDIDIESIVEVKDKFVFLFRSGESFQVSTSAMQDAVLSEEVGCLMGQALPLIEQVGATLFQSAYQNPSIDECCQFGSPSKKIKKEQKGQDKLKSSNKKNTRGSRGLKKKDQNLKCVLLNIQTFKIFFFLE